MGKPMRKISVLRNHLIFSTLSALVLLLLYTGLRAALLIYNHELIGDISPATILEAFLNGVRFDLRVVAYACIPLIIATLSRRAMGWRRLFLLWLTLFASVTIFIGVSELDFYHEFHQRLNNLVFSYIQQDAATVLSMLWHGFPVLKCLLAWLSTTFLLFLIFRYLHRMTLVPDDNIIVQNSPWYLRCGFFVICLVIAVIAVRGTLRQGPPMRWGDVYTTTSVFANQLGLNGTLTLISAAKDYWSPRHNNSWKPALEQNEALFVVRDMLLTRQDQLVDDEAAAVRRVFSPVAGKSLEVKNVVVILMESFAGHYVGALGGAGNITPYFDQLASEGLLFSRYFSNGTHTHQGMFATMASFPNLPGFEYLMQQPEGTHHFSGLPQLLGTKGFDDLYVYNGDFAWDNQAGFFRNQGMHHFIGRHEYINPVFSDPTWGVSDQDMFDRAALELKEQSVSRPFYVLLQTLSNHTPYALPDSLPIEIVTDFGSLNEHLTAMRYSDWALGQFFAKVRQEPFFKDTLFVIVGDHGFGSPEQLSDIDLFRFHVPMLLIGPGVQEKFGERSDIVGTQLDIVPTIMGRLGMSTQHQCWGRDLLGLDPDDQGFGVIKPSGSDQTVALVEGDRLLVLPKGGEPKLYRYRLHEDAGVEAFDLPSAEKQLRKRLEAFLQVATKSLLDDTAGVGVQDSDKVIAGSVEGGLPELNSAL